MVYTRIVVSKTDIGFENVDLKALKKWKLEPVSLSHRIIMVSKVFWVKLISDTGWEVGEDFLEIYFLVCQFFRKKCAAEREKNNNRFWVWFVRLHLVTITNCSNLSVRPTNENPILVEIMSSIKKSAGHSVYTSNPGTSEYLYMFLIQVPQRGR